jgi:nitrate/TMAO reductase-like tetraheme cytochrome c subunit
MQPLRWFRSSADKVFLFLQQFGITRITIVAVVLLFILGGSWGFHASSTPQFCRSCHEMGYYYQTWNSSSHHDINCENCHLGPNVASMIKTKVGALKEIFVHTTQKPVEAQVPRTAEIADAVCRKCHEPKQGELHYHLQRITHQEHLDRGMHCTECHSNVVHGGRTGFKNTPPMTGCMRCHDGEQAPNNCSVCHLKLGEISPSVYNPEWVKTHRANLEDTGRENCKICHGEQYCNSCHQTVPPHGSNWQLQHQKTERTELPKCATCHVPRVGEDMALFCIDCHKSRSAHGPQYVLTHPQDYQQRPQTCTLCHEQNFCTSCHQIYRPHGLDWVDKHGPKAREPKSNCATCHPNRFCQECHTSGRPASHKAEWRLKHGQAAASGVQGCSTCHKPAMCRSCHEKQPPSSHRNATTWNKAHGAVAQGGTSFCYICHDRSACNSCHGGVQMPHSAAWPREHSRSAARNRQVCQKCHKPDYCNSCHAGTRPPSHEKDWVRRHGPTSQAAGAKCSMCHSKRLCDTCHVLPMPHPTNWKKSHGGTAENQPARCAICHQSKDCLRCHTKKPASHRRNNFDKQHATQGPNGALCSLCHGSNSCLKCHQGLAMPHSPDFKMGEHGQGALRSPTACAKCHSQPKVCLTCHDGMAPSGHDQKTFRQSHGNNANDAYCALCHGKQACTSCHSKLTKSPHADDFSMEHKAVAKFERKAKCFLCHKIDYCQQCHEDAVLK